MCGILVEYSFGQPLHEQNHFQSSLMLLKHRGPDAQMTWVNDNVRLGHTRLAIIDLNINANQPFVFDNLVMVYNGEIFNFIELRARLVSLGYVFNTDSDTEVVIKAFHCWGVSAFKKFNGMWALAIYDKSNHQLVVSRDRFGQKPLFYYYDNNRLIVSSEVFPLARMVDTSPNRGSILSFLIDSTMSGISETFFDGIFEFPKSEVWTFTGAKHNRWKYWEYQQQLFHPGSLNNSLHEFEDLLVDSVRVRLISDVKVGLLLSGGLDSSVVAEIVNCVQGHSHGLDAYTFSALGNENEVDYAREVADKVGLNIHIVEAIDNAEDYVKRLRSCVFSLGRAHSSTAIVPMDQLLERVNESGVKVLLDGQGADELLGGYKDYQLLLLPKYFAQGKISVTKTILSEMSRYGLLRRLTFNLKNIAPLWMEAGYKRLSGVLKLVDFVDYAPSSLNATLGEGRGSLLNRLLLSQHVGRLENLLYYGDIISMRNSIENRSPFLDHRLVDFCFSAADDIKFHNGVDKYALRNTAFAQRHEKINLRRKSGFPSPVPKGFVGLAINEIIDSHDFREFIFKTKIKSESIKKALSRKGAIETVYKLYQIKTWLDLYKDLRYAT